MPLAFLAPASPRTPGTGASSPQKLPVSPAELKARTEHARELGDRLAAEAWASADRLLLCLCLRAWRLQRRVALQSSAQWQTRPTWKPGQFPVGSPPWHTTTQSTPANLPADVRPLHAWDGLMHLPALHASWKLSLLPQTPPLPLPSKARPAFDFSLPNFAQSDAGGSYGLATIGGSQDLPEGALLKRSFLSWKDMVASLALLRVKLENVHLKEKLKQQVGAMSECAEDQRRCQVLGLQQSQAGEGVSNVTRRKGPTLDKMQNVSVDLNSPDRLVKFGISSPKVVTPANLPSFVPDVLA
ncbi:unnamed protein product, partial [Symbiodinium sp. KB8]